MRHNVRNVEIQLLRQSIIRAMARFNHLRETRQQARTGLSVILLPVFHLLFRVAEVIATVFSSPRCVRGKPFVSHSCQDVIVDSMGPIQMSCKNSTTWRDRVKSRTDALTVTMTGGLQRTLKTCGLKPSKMNCLFGFVRLAKHKTCEASRPTFLQTLPCGVFRSQRPNLVFQTDY